MNPATIARWVTRQSTPRAYVAQALQQLLAHATPATTAADFTFIDLFAGVGGIRKAFEQEGGRCVFTSEWDSYAQKTYHANYPDGQSINGDITEAL